jgi:hypothetical protein
MSYSAYYFLGAFDARCGCGWRGRVVVNEGKLIDL